jgi:alkylation response protein AidB-like acyl-CoA dehydrogenase
MAERSKVGLAIPHWPKEYGGAGLTLRHLVAIADEMARARTRRRPGYSQFR